MVSVQQPPQRLPGSTGTDSFAHSLLLLTATATAAAERAPPGRSATQRERDGGTNESRDCFVTYAPSSLCVRSRLREVLLVCEAPSFRMPGVESRGCAGQESSADGTRRLSQKKSLSSEAVAAAPAPHKHLN